MSKQRLAETFAHTQRVHESNVSAVDVQFRRQGNDTEIIAGAPLNKRTTVKGYDLQGAIMGPGTSFILESFENAIGRPIANQGRGWIATFDEPHSSLPAGSASATYFIAVGPQLRIGHHQGI